MLCLILNLIREPSTLLDCQSFPKTLFVKLSTARPCKHMNKQLVPTAAHPARQVDAPGRRMLPLPGTGMHAMCAACLAL